MTYLHKPWYSAAVWSLGTILFLTASSSQVASPVPALKSPAPGAGTKASNNGPTANKPPQRKDDPAPPAPLPVIPYIQLPEKVEGLPGAWVVVAPKQAVGGQPQWDIPTGLIEVDLASIFGPDMAAKSKAKVLTGNKPGTYIVMAWNAKGDVASRISRCTIVILGPVPPEPTPGPIPPGPTPPTPTPPAPIPDAGLHILMVYDKAKETTLPPAQGDILFGQDVRNYLNSNCAQVAGKADWAIWWPGVDPSGYPSLPLQALWARPRASLPWVAISKDGKSGYEGPLPADLPAAMALFKKYAE